MILTVLYLVPRGGFKPRNNMERRSLWYKTLLTRCSAVCLDVSSLEVRPLVQGDGDKRLVRLVLLQPAQQHLPALPLLALRSQRVLHSSLVSSKQRRGLI